MTYIHSEAPRAESGEQLSISRCSLTTPQTTINAPRAAHMSKGCFLQQFSSRLLFHCSTPLQQQARKKALTSEGELPRL